LTTISSDGTTIGSGSESIGTANNGEETSEETTDEGSNYVSV
jgi:hypothetical protein